MQKFVVKNNYLPIVYAIIICDFFRYYNRLKNDEIFDQGPGVLNIKLIILIKY